MTCRCDYADILLNYFISFRNAEEQYRKSKITFEVLGIACGDLGKYYKALDRAIMKYHQIKMSEINKIIKDLWIETYRGKGELRCDVARARNYDFSVPAICSLLQ